MWTFFVAFITKRIHIFKWRLSYSLIRITLSEPFMLHSGSIALMLLRDLCTRLHPLQSVSFKLRVFTFSILSLRISTRIWRLKSSPDSSWSQICCHVTLKRRHEKLEVKIHFLCIRLSVKLCRLFYQQKFAIQISLGLVR